MAKIPPTILTRNVINGLLQKFKDDPSVFATEREYFLALYARELLDTFDEIKAWSERYKLNIDSIVARVKKEMKLPKGNRMDLNSWERFLHQKVLALHEVELGRRKIMGIH